MVYSLPQLIVWIIVGLTGGTLAGVIVKRESKGFGFLANLGLGLAGAVIGGVLFHFLGILPDLDKVSVSMREWWLPSLDRCSFFSCSGCGNEIGGSPE